MASRTARALLCLTAVAVAGCPSKKKSEPAAPSATDGRAAVAVKVPLPPGWVAVGNDDGSLRLGPPGQSILRIDPKPGQGDALPSPSELERGFRQALDGAQVSEIDHEDKDDVSLVVLSVSPADPKAGEPAVVLLGAKRVGTDLYLCATAPGARAEDVKLAAGACREIHLPEK